MDFRQTDVREKIFSDKSTEGIAMEMGGTSVN